MKFIRYSVICLICTLLVFLTGCGQKSRVSVVNTNSGIIIRSSDYIQEQSKPTDYSKRIKQVSKPTAKSTGNVIDLGSSYKSIDINSPFGRI